MENDLTISEMKRMQYELYERNKEKWNDMEPKAAKNHLLYMVEEMGECISIIKKKGINEIMNNKIVRNHFTEEMSIKMTKNGGLKKWQIKEIITKS